MIASIVNSMIMITIKHINEHTPSIQYRQYRPMYKHFRGVTMDNTHDYLQLQVAESHATAPLQDASPPPLKASAYWMMMRHFTTNQPTNPNNQGSIKHEIKQDQHKTTWLQSAFIHSFHVFYKKMVASVVDCASMSLWMSWIRSALLMAITNFLAGIEPFIQKTHFT